MILFFFNKSNACNKCNIFLIIHINIYSYLIFIEVFQIVEALSFLHIDVRMMHRNISPESVIINEKGEWKLGGFDFAVQGAQGTNSQV